MTQPIDVTYVELRARGEDDAARDVERAVKEMERDVERASKDMELSLSTAFKDAADNIERELERTNSSLSKKAVLQRRIAQGMADDFTDAFDDIENVIDSATESVLGGGGGGGGGGGLSGALKTLSGQFKNLGGFTPPPILLALAAATPAVLGLGAALADLAGLIALLPGTIAILGAAFATLKTAFSGFGDAVSALASGDLEKIKEAMKNLAPAAQTVAREINALRKPFAELRKEVQQAFFAPIQGDLTRLANAVLPTLRKGMTDVAGAFGELGSQLAGLFGDPRNTFVLGEIFEATARIIRDLSPEIIGFLDAIFGVIHESLPFIEKAFGVLGDGLKSFTDFLNQATESGSFDKFIEDAFATLSDLFDLVKAVFGLLGALFGDADDEGRSFIQTLTAMVERFTEFINSAEGQEVLQRTISALKIMGTVLGVLVEAIILFIRYQNFLIKGVQAIGAALVIAAIAVGKFFVALWGWIQRAGSAVADFFVGVGEFFAGVGRAIQDAWNAVMRFGGQVVDFIVALPGRILAALAALPGIIADAIVGSLNNAAYAVGFAIGSIVAYFRDLPARTWEQLQLLAEIISSVFTAIWDQSVRIFNLMVDAVVFLFTDLPKRIAGALVALFERVRSFFTQARDAGRNRISELIAATLRFFNDLPGKVSSALNSFKNRVISIFTSIKNSAYNIGRDIINGIKNGIVDAIGGAVELAKNAAKRIVQGFKDALKSGSPSKLTADEVGVPIMQGIGVGIQREAPTVRQEIEQATRQMVPAGEDLATGNSGASPGGSGEPIFSFGPGSIQIVFEGVVPSQSEAQRTGMAVGAGIQQTLARQNARTAVRTR